MSERLASAGIELSPDDLAALDARWASAWTPAEVADRLAGIVTPWYVAAGWALDLFRGTHTRAHGDIEIAIPAVSFPEVRSRFPDYAFDAAGRGRIWADATPDELGLTYQTWLRDPATGQYLLDVFREPHDGDIWICRRDASIRLPYGDIIRHTKAKNMRPKDRADFDGVLPLLTQVQRQSLAGLLDQVHPGHPWLPALRV